MECADDLEMAWKGSVADFDRCSDNILSNVFLAFHFPCWNYVEVIQMLMCLHSSNETMGRPRTVKMQQHIVVAAIWRRNSVESMFESRWSYGLARNAGVVTLTIIPFCYGLFAIVLCWDKTVVELNPGNFHIEPTITRVPSEFCGYIWPDTKIVLKK